MEKLIYAILNNNKQPDKLNKILSELKGIGQSELRSVSFEQISAVVCRTEKKTFVATQDVALAYADVVDNLAKYFAILPMRFGSFMQSNDKITKMLQANYTDFMLNLQKVENKLEFGLKVFGNSEKIKEHLKAKHDPESQVAQAKEGEISFYKDYVNKKLKAHRLEELLLAFVDEVIIKITDCIFGLNAVSKIQKMTSESIIVDAVFLLEKHHKGRLIETIKNMQQQYLDLKFVLTGPWPPYNFVDIKIK